ncbi:Outer membrane lipoprotein-sorting protein [Desulfuromusa kysingii]|uniref:Outer membrane lipoprotein-sorting protein n=1 Tax=Desulfuromusa kysingii TaxID=37625 RepID=A0A1H3VP52_9BACT|nr:outer membrane lipoprotein carrier protein LolA [Desulfuromusa kysingii]SDZ76529.1 Outer membrane lipoprotein-sorting protein [Desulfuromusa kysingii]
MLKKIFIKYLLLLSLVFLATTSVNAEELAPLLAELQQAAAETETLSSPFVQEKYLQIFSEKLISNGQFAYQKPDRLRWELLTPVASGFILRGDQGERWNSLSQKQEKFSVKSDPIMGMIAQQLLAWARVDLDWLQSRYRMEVSSVTPIVLTLYPLDQGEATFIDHLNIQFSTDRRHVSEVLMVEQGGDSTLLRFIDAQVNIELAADTFQVPEL